MGFKKDMSKLLYVAPTGKGRLRSITDINWEVTEMFISGIVWVATYIFNSTITGKVLETLSNEYEKEQQLDDKYDASKSTDEYYSKLVNDTIDAWRSYYESDFDRYQYDNICPKNETFWLPIEFINKITKLFDHDIRFCFWDKFIVWVNMNQKPMFIVWWVEMPKQMSLLQENNG